MQAVPKKNLRPEATDTVNAPTPEGAEIVGHVRGALSPHWKGSGRRRREVCVVGGYLASQTERAPKAERR